MTCDDVITDGRVWDDSKIKASLGILLTKRSIQTKNSRLIDGEYNPLFRAWSTSPVYLNKLLAAF